MTAEPSERVSAPAPQRREPQWPRRYASRLIYTDSLILTLTLGAFGIVVLPDLNTTLSWPDGPDVPYYVPLAIIGVMWVLCLDAFDTRDRHIVGHGVVEYRRIVNATFFVFAVIITIAFFLRIEVATRQSRPGPRGGGSIRTSQGTFSCPTTRRKTHGPLK